MNVPRMRSTDLNARQILWTQNKKETEEDEEHLDTLWVVFLVILHHGMLLIL